jgi:hypothetical protein
LQTINPWLMHTVRLYAPVSAATPGRGPHSNPSQYAAGLDQSYGMEFQTKMGTLPINMPQSQVMWTPSGDVALR